MLYLKYRPRTLAELDNSQARVLLTKVLESHTIPHALLFVGQKGTGKTSSARIFAKSVNCLKKGRNSIEPCNECDNCRSIDSGSHPDVVELDAASNRGIDEIRSLIRDAAFSPMSADYRVFIIDEAHMITPDAFNALLKTLEEPPPSVIFILATTNEEKIPKTIISRCFKINFGRALKEDILSKLKKVSSSEKIVIEENVLALIASHAEASFRDAIKILDELVMQNTLKYGEVQRYLGTYAKKNLLAVMQSKKLPDALAWINEFQKQGGSTKSLIEELLQELHDALLSKTGASTEKTDISFTPKEIAYLMKLLNEAYGYLKVSPIESIPLEITVVEFYNKKIW